MSELLKYFSLVPASAAVVLLILWLLREWITVRLSQSVRHEYDKELEKLRDENTKNKHQIDSLQSGALGNLAFKERLFFEKRVDAIDRLWISKCILSKVIMPVQFSSMMKWDVIREEQKTAGFRINALKDIGKVMTSGVSLKDLLDTEGVNIQGLRPYIPDDVWNYYSAYSGICISAMMKMEGMRDGMDLELFTENPYNDQLKGIFPELSEHIDKYGEAAYSDLLSSLSDKILEAIRNFHSGIEADENSVIKAQNILSVVTKVNKENGVTEA